MSFRDDVNRKIAEGVPPDGIRYAAEMLCENSRVLFIRVFGRVGHHELAAVQSLFDETAAQIREWAKTVNEPQKLQMIEAYAQHLERRTGFIKSPFPSTRES